MTYFEDVYLWNHAMGHCLQAHAAVATDDASNKRHILAMQLVTEEFQELWEAFSADDLTEIADACADLVWVVCGLAGAMGIDLDAAWEEVRRTNWAKRGGKHNPMGKLQKPPGWQGPDMSKALDGRDLGEIVRQPCSES